MVVESRGLALWVDTVTESIIGRWFLFFPPCHWPLLEQRLQGWLVRTNFGAQ